MRPGEAIEAGEERGEEREEALVVGRRERRRAGRRDRQAGAQLEVLDDRAEQHDAGRERQEQAVDALTEKAADASACDRAVRRPAGEHEEERHVPLVDEEGRMVERRHELAVLEVVDRQHVEDLGDVEWEEQERRADAEPVEVVAARAVGGSAQRSFRRDPERPDGGRPGPATDSSRVRLVGRGDAGGPPHVRERRWQELFVGQRGQPTCAVRGATLGRDSAGTKARERGPRTVTPATSNALAQPPDCATRTARAPPRRGRRCRTR